MKGLLQDVHCGLRAFRRAPGFTALAVLTLALGIGANTTVFSWINSTLLNPIPGVKDASQMVSIDNGASPTSPLPLSYPDYVDLRDRAQSFSGMIASDIDEMGLTGIGKPEHIWGSLVSANYFDVLGVQPVLGRGFFPADEQKIGGAPIVVISYRLWQTHFAGDKSIVGKSIDINLHRYQVVGIAPPLFQGSQTGLRAELWIPLSMREQILPGSDVLHNRNAKALMVLGRLKPGASAPQAQQEVNVLMRQIAEQYPESHKGNNTLTVYPLWRAPYGANAYFYFLLPMLLAIAGLVLLLACANVANLLLVRAVARRREVAIRLSMGADRWRLVRQFLVESVLLALLGGAGAMLITIWTSGTLAQLIPPANIPISMQVHVDRTVLLAALFISLLTGVIFGVLPAFRSSGLTPVAVLKEESGSTSGGFQKARLSSALVVTQISLSLLLLICAGLFIRSFQQAQRSDPGFNSEHVLLASMNLYAAGYKEADGLEFQRQLLAKVSALPGVQSATLADWVPLGFSMSTMTMKVEAYNPQPHESMEIQDAIVGPNYFSTMEIPLVAGHEFTALDSAKSQPAAIVNQAFVDRFWAHQDAIGKRVYADGKWYSIIAVARNSSYSDLGESPRPFVYFSSFQDYYPGVIIHARVSGDPMVMAPVVEKAVHELNSGLPVYDVTTLKLRTQVATTGERIAGAFAGAFGFIALVLAAIGIYGVIAYTTRQRTHEFGIRFALGAQKRNVFGLVLRQGLRLIVVGVAIGLALAFAITRFLSSMLYGVSATDSLTFIAVIVLLSLVALGACYLPARRAAAIDPLVALRYE